MTKPVIIYSEKDVEAVFQKLVSADFVFKNFYDQYLVDEYRDGVFDERMHYYDIERMGDFLLKELELGKTDKFGAFFIAIEEVLNACDEYIGTLIVIGFFEYIQSGNTKAFDKWLLPTSKKAWKELADFGKKKKGK